LFLSPRTTRERFDFLTLLAGFGATNLSHDVPFTPVPVFDLPGLFGLTFPGWVTEARMVAAGAKSLWQV